MPVCGEVQIQCITILCNPIKQTFPNMCEAENAKAMNIVEGECPNKEVAGGTLFEACKITEGAIWLKEFNQCEYLSQEICKNVGGTYYECGSDCRNDPTAEICTMQCVPYCQG